MVESSSATLEKIQQAALTEFLDKGFLSASLRQIVKNAGVTTGAFYGYFSCKEALFASIVEPHAAALMGRFMEAQTSFAGRPEAEQPEQGQAAEETEADNAQAAAQEVSVSTSDLDLMAAIIECEAGGESYEGKVGVGAVIMNRIRSGEFPNTLSEVIYQSGQFEPTWTGKLSNVLSRGASEACYAAAQDVFAGANTIGDRLFFHAGGGSGLTIGNQTFY